MIRAFAQGKEYNVQKPAKSIGEGIDRSSAAISKMFAGSGDIFKTKPKATGTDPLQPVNQNVADFDSMK